MLAQMQKLSGKECPRVDLFSDNVEVVACVNEMRTLEGSPAAVDDAYHWHMGTAGEHPELQAEFRRKVAMYRNELERLLRENQAAHDEMNRKHNAAHSAKTTGAKGGRRGGARGPRHIGRRRHR